jgi:hypothetical protein
LDLSAHTNALKATALPQGGLTTGLAGDKMQIGGACRSEIMRGSQLSIQSEREFEVVQAQGVCPPLTDAERV